MTLGPSLITMGVPVALLCSGRVLLAEPRRPFVWVLAALAVAELGVLVYRLAQAELLP